MGDRPSYGVIFHHLPTRPPHKMGPSFKQVSTDEVVLTMLKDYGFFDIYDETSSDPMPDIEAESTIRLGATYAGS
jgi:hypothetical protein